MTRGVASARRTPIAERMDWFRDWRSRNTVPGQQTRSCPTTGASALKYRRNATEDGMKKSNGAFIVIVVTLVAALGVEGFILTRPKPKADRPAEA